LSNKAGRLCGAVSGTGTVATGGNRWPLFESPVGDFLIQISDFGNDWVIVGNR
jgi:hypothetical protein